MDHAVEQFPTGATMADPIVRGAYLYHVPFRSGEFVRHTFGLMLRMRSIIHFILFLCTVLPALAQEDDEPVRLFEPYKPAQIILDTDSPVIDTVHAVLPMRPGKVTYLVSPAIEKLMSDYADRKHPLRGYRVQIFLGDRAAAENIKRAFLQKHAEIPAYLSWLAPNFKLRVGDFRTRLEAEKMLHELRTTYPGCFIVPDEVEMPRL